MSSVLFRLLLAGDHTISSDYDIDLHVVVCHWHAVDHLCTVSQRHYINVYNSTPYKDFPQFGSKKLPPISIQNGGQRLKAKRGADFGGKWLLGFQSFKTRGEFKGRV
jgi:hypothetical protein